MCHTTRFMHPPLTPALCHWRHAAATFNATTTTTTALNHEYIDHTVDSTLQVGGALGRWWCGECSGAPSRDGGGEGAAWDCRAPSEGLCAHKAAFVFVLLAAAVRCAWGCCQ